MLNINENHIYNDYLISVIVPIYNAEKYLPRCIESIQKQTHNNLDVILVNDGSTDESGDICEKYKREDTRIRVVHQSNAGPSAARNTGLEIMRGEWFAFVDADDSIDPQAYEKLLDTAHKNNALLAYCGVLKHRLNGQISSVVYPDTPQTITGMQYLEEFYGVKSRGIAIHIMVTKLFHRSLIDNVEKPWFNVQCSYSEDWLFEARLFPALTKMAYLPEPLYCKHQCEGSLTQSPINDVKLTNFIAYERIVKELSLVSSDLAHGVKRRHTQCAIDWLQKAYASNSPDVMKYIPLLNKKARKYLLTFTLSPKISIKTKCKALFVLIAPKDWRVH